jgi:hypothetical protein
MMIVRYACIAESPTCKKAVHKRKNSVKYEVPGDAGVTWRDLSGGDRTGEQTVRVRYILILSHKKKRMP